MDKTKKQEQPASTQNLLVLIKKRIVGVSTECVSAFLAMCSVA